MGEPLRLPPAGFDELPIEEQIDYLQALWDRIAATPERVPVPEWQRALLTERLAAHDADPQAGVPWQQVRDELRAKYRPAR